MKFQGKWWHNFMLVCCTYELNVGFIKSKKVKRATFLDNFMQTAQNENCTVSKVAM